MEQHVKNKKYPDAMSRDLGEGGYAFLKRVLAASIENGRPVVINVGRAYIEYIYTEGDRTLMDGMTVLEVDDKHAVDAISETAGSYSLEQGLAEIRTERGFGKEGRRKF